MLHSTPISAQTTRSSGNGFALFTFTLVGHKEIGLDLIENFNEI